MGVSDAVMRCTIWYAGGHRSFVHYVHLKFCSDRTVFLHRGRARLDQQVEGRDGQDSLYVSLLPITRPWRQLLVLLEVRRIHQ